VLRDRFLITPEWSLNTGLTVFCMAFTLNEAVDNRLSVPLPKPTRTKRTISARKKNKLKEVNRQKAFDELI